MNFAQKTKMYQDIERHGKNLIELFNLSPETDPVKLCKKLHTLEKKASRLTEDECNNPDTDNAIELCKILDKVKKILFPTDEAMLNNFALFQAVFINGDPRGYTLKIKSQYMDEYRKTHCSFHTDMGGYGIIAPEFNGK